MAVGQVSFHNDKKVKRGTSPLPFSHPTFPAVLSFSLPQLPSQLSSRSIPSVINQSQHPRNLCPTHELIVSVHVQSRENAIVNRLNKTKVEKEVDHESERQERLRIEGRKKKSEAQERVCPSLFFLHSFPHLSSQF